MRPPKISSRIKVGDIVFGPSTDYRDVRKAAYQEYVVTTDYNVARLAPETTVKGGAAIGVSYVAAAIALSVSFGVDLKNLKDAPRGPDLYRLVRDYEYQIPEDVRNECVSNVTSHERPEPGEWLAIWGGKIIRLGL